jgi:hypothetical protein
LVTLFGILAIWIVALFFLLAWGNFSDIVATFAARFLSSLTDSMRSYVVLAIVHSLGALCVGFLLRLTIVSSKPIYWLLGAAALMGAIALSETLSFWFTQIELRYQIAQMLLALTPPIFCIIGGLGASRLVSPTQ